MLHSPGDTLTPDQHWPSWALDLADPKTGPSGELHNAHICLTPPCYAPCVMCSGAGAHAAARSYNLSLLVKSKVHLTQLPISRPQVPRKSVGEKGYSLWDSPLIHPTCVHPSAFSKCPELGHIFWLLRLSQCEHGAQNNKLVGSIPVWAILLRVGLNDPCASLWTQNVLWNLFNSLC